MKITIKRTERVVLIGTPDPIDQHEFETTESAAEFLRSKVKMLTDAQIAEIMEYPETNFEHREMINRGHSAYLGTVVYEIEITR